jgi:hypothetical protein
MTKEQKTNTMEWTTSEFRYHRRKASWFFWVTFFLGVLILIGLYTSNPLFVLILILVALLWGYFEQQGPRTVTVRLERDRVVLGDEILLFKEAKDFRIVYEPPEVKMLYINPESMFKSARVIPLEDQDPMTVRRFLAPFLYENLDDEDEPFMDAMSRRLKL